MSELPFSLPRELTTRTLLQDVDEIVRIKMGNSLGQRNRENRNFPQASKFWISSARFRQLQFGPCSSTANDAKVVDETVLF
jgi:hypothetical protein